MSDPCVQYNLDILHRSRRDACLRNKDSMCFRKFQQAMRINLASITHIIAQNPQQPLSSLWFCFTISHKPCIHACTFLQQDASCAVPAFFLENICQQPKKQKKKEFFIQSYSLAFFFPSSIQKEKQRTQRYITGKAMQS